MISNLLKFSLLPILTAVSLIFTLALTSKANGQNPAITSTEITNYAQTVMIMEPKRQQAFKEIKTLINTRSIPIIICNDVNSIKLLPRDAQKIAINYCNEYEETVSENNLTVDRFNQITVEVNNNSVLRERVQKLMMEKMGL
ncbi:hypothetical protein B7O87_07700 [Cylindrospermopsis raciborskii CENA303]|uniref:DUF4168 domain-containing protein n=1 Tax=Cylindrospermopsis raciborskii CENA303 TaxID=1170769 RepID=A0A1X4G6V9_9CYAN|nr:DUF4168 domain-containing protein [Cylindrospermopsis raciborskii]OSO90698.1 hypothetical protein B7O87_07700 [Cylindrospermopsis raciborskii CENA303]